MHLVPSNNNDQHVNDNASTTTNSNTANDPTDNPYADDFKDTTLPPAINKNELVPQVMIEAKS